MQSSSESIVSEMNLQTMFHTCLSDQSKLIAYISVHNIYSFIHVSIEQLYGVPTLYRAVCQVLRWKQETHRLDGDKWYSPVRRASYCGKRELTFLEVFLNF